MTVLTQAYTLQLGPIGRSERMAIMSWRKVGLKVTCFTYAEEPLADLAILGDADYEDAATILPRETIAACRHAQTAIGLFAAAVLHRYGGVWIDPDYVLLRPLPETKFVAIGRDHTRGPIIRPNLLAVAAKHPFTARMTDALRDGDGEHARDVAVAKAMRLYWPKTGVRLDEAAYWPLPYSSAARIYAPAPQAFYDNQLGGVCCHRDAGPHGPVTTQRILHPTVIRQQDGATGDPCWYSSLWRHVFELPGGHGNGNANRQYRHSVARDVDA